MIEPRYLTQHCLMSHCNFQPLWTSRAALSKQAQLQAYTLQALRFHKSSAKIFKITNMWINGYKCIQSSSLTFNVTRMHPKRTTPSLPH